ncbi:MAG: FAD-binding oxidoreductase, partial [Kiloniellales bacterium]
MTQIETKARPDANRFAALREAIAGVVGDKGLIDDPADMAPYLEEPRGLFKGATPFVVRPATTDEVAAVVKLCAAARVPIVPQGGNTGLCGGGLPFERGAEVLVNLGRMNRIRHIDPEDYTLTAEAGCVLQDLQAAAGEVD